MTSSALVSVAKLNCFYGDYQALQDVSLSLSPGEIVSILGPNGAGKTTLINTLLGKKKHYQGEVTVFGNQPGALQSKRRTGAMLQVASMPDSIKVHEYLELFQTYYPNPRPIEELIALAGLDEVIDSYSNDLSGGQSQRVLLALALSGNPELLFLDEPSVGMDIKSRRRLWDAIRSLKKEGTCIVLTTHYLEEADQLSDRILFLNKGQIQQEGTPESIKKSFSNQTISLNTDVLPELFENLSGVISVSVRDGKLHILTSDSIRTLEAIFNHQLAISDLSVTGTSLEDAFLAMDDTDSQAAA